MKFPGPLSDSLPVLDLLKQILNFLRASRVLSINGVPGRESPNGTLFQIPVGGSSTSGGSSRYVPWAPQFFTEGTDPSIVYKCTFNLGALNDVAPSNWDTEHTLDDLVYFVVLEVTTADGKVTGLEITIPTTAPTADSTAKDTPPTLFKIVLGVIGQTSGSMIETKNLNAIAAEIYRESKSGTTVGEEAFSRWWRWNHSEV